MEVDLNSIFCPEGQLWSPSHKNTKKKLQNCDSKGASRQNCVPNLNMFVISSKGKKL
jgi:hypothetical protein